MEDKLNALDRLIEAVEDRTASGDIFSAAFPSLDYNGTLAWRLVWRAYTGDLNSFNRLLKLLLPDWRARLDIGKRNRCWMVGPQNQKIDAYGADPARAGLLAILRAYRSVQA